MFNFIYVLNKINFREMTVSEKAIEIATKKSFEIKGFLFSASNEELRKPRIVKIGIIQNKIVLPTTAPLADQRDAIHKRVADMISAGAQQGVNIICLQEAWSESTLKTFV